MKYAQNIAAVIILTAAMGCTSFEQNAGKTVKAVSGTVEYSRQGWTNYVWSQRALVPDPVNRQDLEKQVLAVGMAYGKYQAAMRSFNLALTIYHNTPSDMRDKAPVQTALAMLTAASGELIGVIQSFSK
jgi:hypothetical protein